MGLLTVGTPLNWADVRQHADYVRKKGIVQFLNIYKNLKNRRNDGLKWGDEVEFNVIKFDHEKKRVYLLLKAETMLPILQEAENKHEENLATMWRPEYANYMIEGTPGSPYGHEISNFNLVEENMRLRREQAQALLGQHEFVFSLTAFPMLGCSNFTWPNYAVTPNSGVTRSLFYPDQVVFPGHPRFATLTQNIRERRSKKVAINIPIFVDTNTPQPFVEDLSVYGEESGESEKARLPNHIYLDAMGFGMGCSCLQMTFQAQSIEEARHLYDQLTPLTPILLALSAASPIWRGFVSDVDCRWNVISGSVDDRTDEEMGLVPLKENKFRIFKSRYDSIDCYLSEAGSRYNDINVVKDEQIYGDLLHSGIDELLAQHIAHLFIRDPISLFKEKIDIDDEKETDHFENIQSTNWQTMRFKPPPMNSSIGWRVEFRPTELQLTDFENAAFATFIVLLTRAILSFKINLLIPISKVDENMQTAQKRDACRTEKFYFRKSIFTDDKKPVASQNGVKEEEYELMSINEILNGKDSFPGLIQLIREYLNDLDVDVHTQCTIKQYLKLLGGRASGEKKTCASWMRDFVMKHPKYEHDSRVSDEIAYDLMWQIHLISSGQSECSEMFYKFENKKA